MQMAQAWKPNDTGMIYSCACIVHIAYDTFHLLELSMVVNTKEQLFTISTEHKLKAEKPFLKNVTYKMVPIHSNGNHTWHVQAFIVEGLEQEKMK